MPYFHHSSSAEQANEYHLGVSGDAIDPEIDRHRVPEIAQVGQPDAGQLRAIHLPGGGKCGEIAVGE